METKYSRLGLPGCTLVHTAPKGLIAVYRGTNGLYFLVLTTPNNNSRAVIASDLISKKAAIQLANDKEFLY